MDVRSSAKPTYKLAAVVMKRPGLNQKPTIVAVSSADPQYLAQRLSCLERFGITGPPEFAVIRMRSFCSDKPLVILHRTARIVVPALVEPARPSIRFAFQSRSGTRLAMALNSRSVSHRACSARFRSEMLMTNPTPSSSVNLLAAKAPNHLVPSLREVFSFVRLDAACAFVFVRGS